MPQHQQAGSQRDLPQQEPQPVEASLRRDLAETREFFTPKAVGWEKRFPDDGPVFAWAIDQLGLSAGEVALDAGCGTGRALGLLRRTVGSGGAALGVDATPAMIAEAVRLGRREVAACWVGDVGSLPLRDGSVAAVLASGLIPHLSRPQEALQELARVCRPDARLGVFHPVGRRALAARHSSTDPDDMNIAPRRIRPLLEASGWQLQRLHDEEDRYLALAVRDG